MSGPDANRYINYDYGSNTCYNISRISRSVSFANYNTVNGRNYPIVEFEDILK